MRAPPAPSHEHSLTLGPDSPILLQDHYLIEQMAMFNREVIPQRQPHAKGGGAFDHFEAISYGKPFIRCRLWTNEETRNAKGV
jgi:catalase